MPLHPRAASKGTVLVALGVAAILTMGTPRSAASGDVITEDVVTRVRAQDDAVRDETARVEIRRIDAKGVALASTHRLYWKNLHGDKGLLGKTVLVSLSPLEKRGEGFLLWQAERADESQAWLYLPELRQVRRVAIAGHDQHAHGDDASADLNLGFEQLGTRLTGATGALIGKEALDGVAHLILEDRSVAAADLLPLRRFWISATDGTIGKVEYRDADGRLARTQTILWARIGEAWVWKHTEIHQADGSGKTIVDLHDIVLNTDLADRLFTVETLKSGRVP